MGVAIVVLMLSGALLHSESLRGSLADFRYVLVGLHMTAGLLFGALFFANMPYIRTYWPGQATGINRRLYLRLLAVITLVWTVSGGGLLLAVLLGWFASARNGLYETHLFLAGPGTLIVLPHLLQAVLRCGPSGQSGVDSGRRDLLRYVVGGILFLGIQAVWKRLNQLAGTVQSESSDIFVQCNQMNPAPVPLPDSSPPKGGGYTGRFRVYKIERQIPCTTTAGWQFRVSGLVDRPQLFRWEDFLNLPRVVQVSDFHCVEGWSVNRITYEGVRLAELLDRAGVRPQAKYVKFYSAEKVYTDALSLEQAQLPDVMAAVLLDGRAIPSDLGGPLRLVVPQMFAYKAVKWLVGMELTDVPHNGYWEARGYPVDAWVEPRR